MYMLEVCLLVDCRSWLLVLRFVLWDVDVYNERLFAYACMLCVCIRMCVMLMNNDT